MTVKILHWLTMSIVMNVLFISGCGTAKQPPTEKLAGAESAINLATDSKARDYAALELKWAQDNLESAKEAVQRQDYDNAARLADQALVDAKLAEAKAQSEIARKATKDLRESIETLRQEVTRKR